MQEGRTESSIMYNKTWLTHRNKATVLKNVRRGGSKIALLP